MAIFAFAASGLGHNPLWDAAAPAALWKIVLGSLQHKDDPEQSEGGYFEMVFDFRLQEHQFQNPLVIFPGGGGLHCGDAHCDITSATQEMVTQNTSDRDAECHVHHCRRLKLYKKPVPTPFPSIIQCLLHPTSRP